MDVFPETIRPDQGFTIKPTYKTVITPFDTGAEFRRRKWKYPRRHIEATFSNLSRENYDLLADFLYSKYGSYAAFYLFDYLPRKWYKEFVGYGDGTLTTFTLPGKEIDQTTIEVFIGGTLTTDYTFSQGTGPNGEDEIVFTTAPATNSLIESSFIGRLRMKVRLNDDYFDVNYLSGFYTTVKLNFIEVR